MTHTRPSKLPMYTLFVYSLLLTYQTCADPVSYPFEQEKTQSLTFESYQLSDKERQRISKHVHTQLRQRQSPSNSSSAQEAPSSIQLGMNGIPVFTQGQHGACVTFALAAAIDAALGQGQYTSPLCLLQLGQHLERMNGEPSGWNGANDLQIFLKRINNYGIISIENQQKYGCGGVHAYPEKEETPTSEMTLKNYLQHSDMIFKNKITWSVLWSNSLWSELFASNDPVQLTQQALSTGHRVVIATMLPRIYAGKIPVGAIGTYQVSEDTWVLTPEIQQTIDMQTRIPGHAMIVTGYDNHVCATDRSNWQHCGLFTLRSSWGPNVGNGGDFYMSYDYFNTLAVEGIQIGLANTIQEEH
ncbi:MAG: peptidase C1 [Legionella sp.]|nr:MAG: peptidase C1 [Legionella sp.]